jgi:hypothetical protein
MGSYEVIDLDRILEAAGIAVTTSRAALLRDLCMVRRRALGRDGRRSSVLKKRETWRAAAEWHADALRNLMESEHAQWWLFNIDAISAELDELRSDLVSKRLGPKNLFGAHVNRILITAWLPTIFQRHFGVEVKQHLSNPGVLFIEAVMNDFGRGPAVPSTILRYINQDKT